MKVAPHSNETEQAVLGAIMLEKHAYAVVSSIITEADFYDNKHKAIFSAFEALSKSGSPIDMLTVTKWLKNKGKLSQVGVSYISELTERVASAAHIESHSYIIKQDAIKRQTIDLCMGVISKAYDGEDAFEVLDELSTGVININASIKHGRGTTLKTAVENEQKAICEMVENGGALLGLPTGFNGLDKCLGGWQRSKLTVVAGRPGMGKTAFVVMTGLHAAKQGKRVLLFSLEMSKSELANRVICHEAQLNNNKLKKPSDLTSAELKSITDVVSTDNLIIDDTASMTIDRIHAKAKSLHIEGELDMVIVDYLQLMSGKEGNREQQISAISRGCKTLAKDLDIPVIALSQLSRSVETRGGDKRPILSDLRESGAIEQDADNVVFIYRPEYYGIEVDENNNSVKGLVEFIVAKARGGSLETTRAKFDGATSTMSDFEDAYQDTFEQPAKFRAELPEEDIPF
jgi:replicative DNA helicase